MKFFVWIIIVVMVLVIVLLFVCDGVNLQEIKFGIMMVVEVCVCMGEFGFQYWNDDGMVIWEYSW